MRRPRGLIGLIGGVAIACAVAAGPGVGARPQPAAHSGLAEVTCQGSAVDAERGRAGKTLCTHGPDGDGVPFPNGVAFSAEAANDASLAAATTPGVRCYGDGSTGPRVQAVYAHFVSQPDNFATMKASIFGYAAQVEAEVAASAAETGGQRHVRWVTDANCNLNVLDIALPDPTPSLPDGFSTTTVPALKALGLDSGDRAYLVWADASRYCGIGSLYTDDTAGFQNRNFFGPSWSRVDKTCWGKAETHELGHNLGAVQRSAPHSNNAGHCTDEFDLMCYDDPNGRNLNPNISPAIYTTVLCQDAAHDRRWDCNHDDYFSTAPAPGSYLATHWNSADSPFLAKDEVGSLAGDGSFHPISPRRVFDGREGAGPIGPGTEQFVQVTGQFGVPPTGVSAVALNVTVTGAVSPGYLSLYSIDDPRDKPYLLSSNLNYSAGQTVANSVTVTVPYDGMISVYSSAGTPYAIIDVAGWYTDRAGYSDQKGGYHPLAPSRVLDTRSVGGGPALAEGVLRDIPIGGVGSVPATASAVVFSLTALGATKSTWVTAWPTGDTMPVVSNLNLTTGQVVANQVIVKLGRGGMVSLVNAKGTLDAIADITGWYDNGGADAATGYVYHAISPIRAVDTRTAPAQPLLGSATRAYDLVTLVGLPATGVAAVTANITVTEPNAAGWLTVWPADGTNPPTASLLNFPRNSTVPALASITLKDNRANFVINTGTAQLLVDVTGWFGPPAA